MSDFMSHYLVPAAVIAVAIVLVLGLVNMMRGGSPNRSQKLMRLRVLLQFVAIIVPIASWPVGPACAAVALIAAGVALALQFGHAADSALYNTLRIDAFGAGAELIIFAAGLLDGVRVVRAGGRSTRGRWSTTRCCCSPPAAWRCWPRPTAS